MKCMNCSKGGVLQSFRDKQGVQKLLCQDCVDAVLGTAKPVAGGPVPAGYEVVDPEQIKHDYFIAGVRWERKRTKSPDQLISRDDVIRGITAYETELEMKKGAL